MSTGVILSNKKGLALAADSAVTYGNRNAIFNSAQKIFALGDKPIGALIYGRVNFMHIPIDVIINQFSKYIIDHDIRKDTVRDYLREFFRFIEEKREFFGFNLSEASYSRNIVKSVILDLFKNLDDLNLDFKKENILVAKKKNTDFWDGFDYRKIEGSFEWKRIKEKYPKLIEETFLETLEEKPYERDMNKYPLNEDDNVFMAQVDYLLEKYGNAWYYHQRLVSEVGLVFAGFGEKELFPASEHVSLFAFVNESLIYFHEESESINYESTRIISIYAQRDSIDAVINGVSQNVQELIEKTYKTTIEEFIKNQKELFKDNGQEKMLGLLEESVFVKSDKEIRKKMKDNWGPIWDSVQIMPMQDLCDLAEGFVNVQSFRRKYEADPDSNSTVGGPIDVAQITKHGGFSWIKKKTK